MIVSETEIFQKGHDTYLQQDHEHPLSKVTSKQEHTNITPRFASRLNIVGYMRKGEKGVELPSIQRRIAL